MSQQEDLDDATLLRIARSFYVVRMVRYAALLVSLGVVLALSLARDAPYVVSLGAGLVILALLVAAIATHRRWVRAAAQASGQASGSPRA